MKKRLYFDTSAVIKEFAVEVGSELIDRLTTKAREGDIQIVSSVWMINEALAVIDRKFRKNELKLPQVQKIIATFAERIKTSSQTAIFLFAPVDHTIISRSRNLINGLHISADDALHLYTAWVVDCQYFLVHDHKIITRVKSKQHEDLKIIDLGDQNDIQRLESELSI